jgi:hypothetical protein
MEIKGRHRQQNGGGRRGWRERVRSLCIVISCRRVVVGSKGIQNRRVLERMVLVVIKSGSLCRVVVVVLGILQAWVNGQVVIHGRVSLSGDRCIHRGRNLREHVGIWDPGTRRERRDVSNARHNGYLGGNAEYTRGRRNHRSCNGIRGDWGGPGACGSRLLSRATSTGTGSARNRIDLGICLPRIVAAAADAVGFSLVLSTTEALKVLAAGKLATPRYGMVRTRQAMRSNTVKDTRRRHPIDDEGVEWKP